MEKAKITQKHADNLNMRLKEYSKEEIVEKVLLGDFKNYKDLVVWDSLDTLIRALYIGYEVEPEFKLGDWLFLGGDVIKIVEVTERCFVLDGGYGTKYKFVIYENFRHATPEEIEKEKTRRWWAKYDREEGELKAGDVVLNTQTDKIYMISDFSNKKLRTYEKVVCFTQDRKDI